MVGAKCIHEFYSTMHDNCYTYMHDLHYSYGMMQCINKSKFKSKSKPKLINTHSLTLILINANQLSSSNS